MFSITNSRFYLLYIFPADIELKGHKIFFEDKESNKKQISFTGAPFIVMCEQYGLCSWTRSLFVTKKQKIKNLKKYVYKSML